MVYFARRWYRPFRLFQLSRVGEFPHDSMAVSNPDQGVRGMSRRARIEALLLEEPGDVFLRYSLALEFEKEGHPEESLRRLTELTREQPAYVPAFFMAAQQLARQQRGDEARAFLRDGIEHARGQGDHHAAGEMSELLASLGPMG
ncbi:MAG TPA: hypothetical protein VIY86_05885 [Pirellulaceae bacterium]